MAHQVRAGPTKIASKLYHHGLIKLTVQDLLQRRNATWELFILWNEFQIELQPEDKNNSPSKRHSTPRSGKRKRRSISQIVLDQNSPAFKKAKKNLDFSNITKKEEAPTQGKNILNLSYTNSEDEEE